MSNEETLSPDEIVQFVEGLLKRNIPMTSSDRNLAEWAMRDLRSLVAAYKQVSEELMKRQ